MHLYTILLTKATLAVQNAIQGDKGVALQLEQELELELELEGGTYDVISISAKHGSQLPPFCTGQLFPCFLHQVSGSISSLDTLLFE